MFALGIKRGMTTVYNDDGAQNVTLVEVVPNTVDAIRTEEKDGYSAVRVTMPETKKKTVAREFRVDSTENFEIGKEVTAEIFSEGDTVRVSGTSKAKGFQGVVKRHGFKGGPASHGHRHVLRKPGSIGSAFPQHVIKGKRMAGRMGGTRATSGPLTVVTVDADTNLIALKGAVPGVNGRIVEIAGYGSQEESK